MTSVFSTSIAGLNGAVRQFEAAASRIAGAADTSVALARAPSPLDSVVIVGSRAPGDTIDAIIDATIARYSFDANAKALTIINQTQNSLIDIKI